jgi:hypothetical protein
MRAQVFTVAGALLATGGAHAEPGATSSVSGPSVTRGEAKIELRTGYLGGGALDGDWAHRAQASYAFTDWWRPTLIVRASQPDGESVELSSIAIENVVDFTATREWPVHFGGQFQYKFGVHGAGDEIEFKLLAERNDGPVNTRVNLVAERPVEDTDWTHEYAARATWRASEALTLGLEAFGEPEADAHYIGPRAGVRFGDMNVSLGYLMGLDDAQADGQVRMALEITP